MTNLVRYMSDEEKYAAGVEFKTTEQGAATSVWCLTSPQLDGKGGIYCMDADIGNVIKAEDLHGFGQVMSGVLPWVIILGFAERLGCSVRK
ncbi:hypothetical protein [Paenibacillus sp. N3.4]|uniref:hypothetical protein n=1 Tax=Paenibacillus sp. N3.4 TaxID=2603222 RepID=UPI0021C49B6C|nr:hypothetical protein [Paenibacillus sp. N3.4]